jgi:hypothetical protein
METVDNRYSRAIVYRLIDIGYNKVYYGSTTQMLSKRMSDHRSKYRQWIAGKPVSHCRAFDLFDEYGIENCKIELVEEYPCKSLADLLKREGYHIQSSQCLNKIISGRTDKEYWEQNKERYKQLRIKKKDIIREQMREYREKHKDALKAGLKEWRLNNKDKTKAHQKAYREAHREAINARQVEPIVCEVCGVVHVRNGKARHERSKKHLRALEENTK